MKSVPLQGGRLIPGGHAQMQTLSIAVITVLSPHLPYYCAEPTTYFVPSHSWNLGKNVVSASKMCCPVAKRYAKALFKHFSYLRCGF